MGAVWVARDTSTDSRVALKLLGHAASDRHASRRFRREAEALGRLSAPNSVRILDHGLQGDVPYIVMELLEGESLRALLEHRGPLPVYEALDILAQAAASLREAHELGIIHRDIKPSNLFLVHSNSNHAALKVIDFGIATGQLLEQDSHASTTGFVGSPAYMSPEQARGEEITPSTDVWSLAVVAFQALTGREPFAGANVPDTLQRICSGVAPVPSEAASGLPSELDAVFERAFAARALERYQSVDDLLTGLRAAVQGAEDCAAVSRDVRRPRGRRSETIAYAPVAKPPATLKRAGIEVAWVSGTVALLAALLLLARPSSTSSPPGQPSPATASPALERPGRRLSAPETDSKFLAALPAPTLSAPALSALAPEPRRPPRALAKLLLASPAPTPSAAASSALKSEAAGVDPVFGLPVAPSHARATSSPSAAGRGPVVPTN
jgi:serine/threonine-protein kinase